LKENNNQKKAPLTRLKETSESDLKQCADKNLGTKFRKRGNPLYLAFTPQPGGLGNRSNLARLSDISFSFHFGFSATVKDLQWGLVVPGQRPTTRTGRTTLRPSAAAIKTPRTVAADTNF
jgi:hypothetical protein